VSGLWFLILLRSLIDLSVKERLDKLAEKWVKPLKIYNFQRLGSLTFNF
jgi:hypothetical protein